MRPAKCLYETFDLMGMSVSGRPEFGYDPVPIVEVVTIKIRLWNNSYSFHNNLSDPIIFDY